MNWSKYTLDEWLEQFGAWSNSCRMQTGHCPDNLQVNLIDKLMIETGCKKLEKGKPKVECKITDDEALQVQDLILIMLRRANGEIKQAVQYLYLHKVNGYSLRKISKTLDINRVDLTAEIRGAEYAIATEFKFIKI